jgi:hypothetical protein
MTPVDIGPARDVATERVSVPPQSSEPDRVRDGAVEHPEVARTRTGVQLWFNWSSTRSELKVNWSPSGSELEFSWKEMGARLEVYAK